MGRGIEFVGVFTMASPLTYPPRLALSFYLFRWRNQGSGTVGNKSVITEPVSGGLGCPIRMYLCSNLLVHPIKYYLQVEGEDKGKVKAKDFITRKYNIGHGMLEEIEGLNYFPPFLLVGI